MDYKELIDNLTEDKIKQLLDTLKISYIDKKDYLLCKTGCHNIDIENASWKLYYYKNSHIFMCYSECGPMSIFKFLKKYYETRDIEYNWYNDIYLVVCDCSNFRINEGFEAEKYKKITNIYTKTDIPILPEYSKNILDCFIKTYPIEWLQDGISKQAMDTFNILYSISQNKIIIPHYDINNRLVGIRGRALDKWEIENIGKYAPIKIEQIWYKHPLSLNLYGLNHTKNNIKENKICFIFESEKSVLQLESFNMKNCAVAVCGSNFNKFQLNILLKECHPDEIVICFDKEELPKKDDYFNKLYSICIKYQNYSNFSFIYDRYNLLDYKDSPSDKGEEIFKELLKKRVKI